MKLSLNIVTAISLAGLAFSNDLLAEDVSHSIRSAAQNNTSNNSFIQVGVEMSTGSGRYGNFDEIRWIINGNLNWNGFFIEQFSDNSDPFTEKHGTISNPITLGYNFSDSEKWSFDTILSRRHKGGSCKVYIDSTNSCSLKSEGDAMLGGRLTHYIDNTIIQLMLEHDVSGNHQGNIVSALVGQSWQYRNWNFHGLLSAQYTDDKLNNYYYGLSENELENYNIIDFDKDNMRLLDVGSGFKYTAEIGATYPLLEDWIFKATARYISFSGAVLNSDPIIGGSGNDFTTFRTSISYVF
ncbi:MipA/OmpV family protein [Pseudoalteromonas denitrificans]|uniref:MltA-interacting protein MipA n=1 Tax=Pseudoalteromonas denitrificans DSM 6059 TaxID=1123010 RepID=A0A1I1NJJ3_9GAMM|nr:MipA/OmpV family protein [Pseudoalteromonas denitrificans]SFC97819.1 MltA-interacting protein MipA [Pseudoalteromonas denitrificans DSM 6059]